MAELRGDYFFADFTNQRIWSLQYDESDPDTHNGSNFSGFEDHTADLATWCASNDCTGSRVAVTQIVSFAEDAAGELYILDLGAGGSGKIFKIVPDLPPPDRLPVVGTYANTVLSSGPLYYYRFEEAASWLLDSAVVDGAPQFGPQNGFSEEMVHGVAGPRTGDALGRSVIGSDAFSHNHNSARLNGISSLAKGDASTMLDLLDQGPLTLEMFFKPDSGTTPSLQQLAAKGTCCGTNSWFMLYLGSNSSFPQGTIRFGIDAGWNTNNFLDTETLIPTGEWSHLAATYDPGTGEAQIFVNGELDAKEILSGEASQSPGDPLFIGAISVNGNIQNYVQGDMDEVALFGRVLSASEIFAHYNAALGNQTLSDMTWISDQSGRWQESANWDNFIFPGGNNRNVVFTGVISTPRTVVTDADVTVHSLTFESQNEYIIAGNGDVNLEADSGNAALLVLEGNHQFQTVVNLHSATDVDVAAESWLTINNALNLNGHDFTKSGDGVLVVNNSITGGTVSLLDGMLAGNAVMAGSVENHGGILTPGNSPGMMSIGGDFLQGEDGTLLIEIGAGEHDLLTVAGTAELAGNLEIFFMDGFQPAAGVSFDMFEFTSVVGEFDSVLLPTLAGGLSWDISSLYTTGTLTVVPEPSMLLLFCIGLVGGRFVIQTEKRSTTIHTG